MLKINKPKIGFIGRDKQDVLRDLRFAVKNGFDYYEIQGLGKRIDFEPEMIKKIKKIAKENNITLNLHTIQYLNPIASLVPEISSGVIKFIKKEIILAHKIGARIITMHGGEKDKPKRKDLVEKNFKTMIENLKEIVKFGKKYKIKIGLENSFSPEKLCRTHQDLLMVVGLIKGLKITFDIGHANIINLDYVEYFKKIKNFVVNIHLHDNNGKFDEHKAIGKGNIDFKKFLKECKKYNYSGPFILEVFSYQGLLKSREKILKIWNKI